MPNLPEKVLASAEHILYATFLGPTHWKWSQLRGHIVKGYYFAPNLLGVVIAIGEHKFAYHCFAPKLSEMVPTSGELTFAGHYFACNQLEVVPVRREHIVVCRFIALGGELGG